MISRYLLLCGNTRRRIGSIADDSLPFLYCYGLSRIYVGELVNLAAGPLNFYRVSFCLGSQSERQGQFALGQITRSGAQHFPLLIAPGDHVHYSADPVAVRAPARVLLPRRQRL